jgi:hypothetical protein
MEDAMAVKINEYRQRKIEAQKSLDALLTEQSGAKSAYAELLQKQAAGPLADDEKPKLADAEKQMAGFDGRLTAQRRLVTLADEDVATEEERLQAEDAELARNPSGRIRVDDPNALRDPAKGFKTPRECLLAIMQAGRTGREDERLKMLAQRTDDGERGYLLPVAFTPRFLATAGSDEHGEYDIRYGGTSVTTTRLAPLPLVGFEGDPSTGRTEMIPMASPVVEMEAATDKDHSATVSAGLTVARRAETVAITASRQTREMITLKASSVFGLAFATEELLSDSPGTFIARIQQGFSSQFAAYMFNEKLRGKGGDQFLGILTALAATSLGPTISIAKETAQVAATIVYHNVIKMRARSWGYSNAIWMANHDTYPQLAVLAVPVGVGGQLIYQQSMVEDRPDMLLGRPIFYSEYMSTLGGQGDLVLANWGQFLEGLYQPLQSAESIHVRFVNHERAIKFWLRNAGAPSWRVPLTPNKSTSTLSPFVTLDARA